MNTDKKKEIIQQLENALEKGNNLSTEAIVGLSSKTDGDEIRTLATEATEKITQITTEVIDIKWSYDVLGDAVVFNKTLETIGILKGLNQAIWNIAHRRLDLSFLK